MNSNKPPPKVAFPRSLSISITGACNLNCGYCFYANEMEGLKDLPFSSWLKFFDELEKMGVFYVTLSGGEPFIRPDLFELIDGLIARRMRYSILSNGTLIDENIASRIMEGKRRIRLNSIQISIDGSTAEIHDRSRPGSFTAALQGLKTLRKFYLPVAVRVTINRHNIDDLENIARLLLEEIGLPSFSTNEAMPIGSGCRQDADMALTPGETLKAMAMIGRLQRRYPGRLKADAGPQAKRKMYAEMMHARRTGEKTSRWLMGYLSSCGCVYSKIDILHDGTIVPCCMMPNVVLGNIRNDSLSDVWRQHPVLAEMRLRRTIPMSEVPGCETCEWNPYCNGSCPGLAHQLTGEINRANPTDCFRNFLKETGAKYDLQT